MHVLMWRDLRVPWINPAKTAKLIQMLFSEGTQSSVGQGTTH